jgi:hypothetical protein
VGIAVECLAECSVSYCYCRWYIRLPVEFQRLVNITEIIRDVIPCSLVDMYRRFGRIATSIIMCRCRDKVDNSGVQANQTERM